MNRILILVILLSLNLPALAGPHDLGRSYLNSFVRVCRRVLIRVGAVYNPIDTRRQMESVRKTIRTLAEPDIASGVPEGQAIRVAEVKFLEGLGYDPGLIRRWKKYDPGIFKRVLYHPNNAPVVGYRVVKTDPEKFRLDTETWYQGIFFEYYGVSKSTAQFYGIDNADGIYIFERIQIPAFSSGISPAPLSLSENPPWYPSVDPRYTKNFRAIVTHLQFPDINDRWYPVDEVISDDRLDMSKVHPQ